jgi:hypothetical protein
MAKAPPDKWMRNVSVDDGNEALLLDWIAPTVYAVGDYWRAIRCGLLGGDLPHLKILSLLPEKYGGTLKGAEVCTGFEVLALATARDRDVDLETARRWCRDQGEQI